MLSRRRGLLACLLVAVAAVPAPAAARDVSEVPREVRNGATARSSGGHFLVHYAERGSHAISAARARELARYAEKAWRVEIGRWGWPAPLDDGDGRLDIYVYGIAAAGQVTTDRTGEPATSWMAVHPDYVNPVTVAHELLHMSQAAIMAANHGQVLDEGLAHWAGHTVARSRYSPDWATFDPIRPFGCTGYTSCVFGKWAFFEFIAERYGHRALVDSYRRAAAMEGDPEERAVPAIDAALRARRGSIGAALTGYVAAVTAADFRLGVLRTFSLVPAARLALDCRESRARTLPIDHLAGRWVELDSVCFADEATLQLSVTWPAALSGVRPAIAALGEIEGLRLRRGTGTLTTTIPATALATKLTLGLGNPSLEGDRQPFRVTLRSTRRPLARVRILSPPRAARGRPRHVSVRARSSRRVWLGVGFRRPSDEAESVSLVRAPRGKRTLRVPVPDALPAGRYWVSVRAGAIIDGPGTARVKLPARR